MCGIAGALQDPPRHSEERLRAIAAAMGETLRHRGPDGDGVWCDAPRGVALAHTRLAIVDLSPTGAQPMVSRDMRWVLAFNGEIYNHTELRERLEATGSPLRGTSDTEVLLEAMAAWGPEKALERSNGMFALALWDRLEQRLLLARDRMGEKPLYYGRFDDTLLFASELKSLHHHPAFVARVDPDAVAAYLRHGYVPAPLSIFQGVRKLPAGCVLWVRRGGDTPTPERYWNLDTVATRGAELPWRGTALDAADEVEALVSDAVRLRMRADVPVGAFLSGGLDSSLVVALMRAHAGVPVRTFSIGFDEPAYDEARHARAVAAHLGTTHTELIVTPAEVSQLVPRLADVYDEPFADSSQIPTCLLAALTRAHVTVALSGDGGDELFGGYARYRFHDRLERTRRALPGSLRRPVARTLRARDAAWWERRLAPAAPLLRSWAPPGRLGERVHRLGDVLDAGDGELYTRLTAVWPDPSRVLRRPVTAPDEPEMLAALPPRGSARLRHMDQGRYLPDDLLVKVDRATMAVGLEARVPLLDHRLVELSWRLPERLLLRDGGKWVLRQVAARHVPRHLTDRPKTGFGVPVDAWLRGPLRPWADDLLADATVWAEGLLDPDAVTAVWSAHRENRADHGPRLWSLLMLRSWTAHWRPR